jgi:hypothetical protein
VRCNLCCPCPSVCRQSICSLFSVGACFFVVTFSSVQDPQRVNSAICVKIVSNVFFFFFAFEIRPDTKQMLTRNELSLCKRTNRTQRCDTTQSAWRTRDRTWWRQCDWPPRVGLGGLFVVASVGVCCLTPSARCERGGSATGPQE